MDLPQLNQWTPSDAAGVNEFLNTPLGRKFMIFLHNYKPRAVIDKGMDNAALTGAFAAGYELCTLQIYSACRVMEQVDVSVKTADMTKD